MDEFRDAELKGPAEDSEDNTQTKSDPTPSVLGQNYCRCYCNYSYTHIYYEDSRHCRH